MAALLVALAVMSVLMSAVLPAWRHQAKREKEAELIFRGEQYVRAIALWERRHGPGARPPSVDILVEQRFLRKKYKDPMTEDGEFQLLFMGVNPVPGAQGGRGGAPAQGAGTITFGGQTTGGAPTMVGGVITGPGGDRGGGLFGVASKSRETAIRVYPPPGRLGPGVPGAQSSEPRRYNEWLFVHAGTAAAPGGGPGAPQPGTIGPPMPGGRGIGPGAGRGGRGMGGRGQGGRGVLPFGRGGSPGPNRP